MTNNLLEVHKKIMSAGYAERLSEYPNKVSTRMNLGIFWGNLFVSNLVSI